MLTLKDELRGRFSPDDIEPGDSLTWSVKSGSTWATWFKADVDIAAGDFRVVHSLASEFPSVELSQAQAERIDTLARMLYEINAEGGADSYSHSTYGHIVYAIKAMIRNDLGLDLAHVDFNWGGEWTFREDVMSAIRSCLKVAEPEAQTFSRDAEDYEVDVYPRDKHLRLCGGPGCYDGKTVLDLGTTLMKFGIANAAGEHGIAVYEPNKDRSAAFWSHNHWGPPNDAHGVKTRQPE
jgi:hypothetical protein